jgi:uncharacterized protein (TIGR03083 family)
MDRDRVLLWTRSERLSVACLLEDLAVHEWRADSLCAGWTVHDVAAHLTLSTRTTFLGTLRGAVRARGDWNRMEFDAARERAARFDPPELVAQIRETAASDHRAPLASPMDPLVDFLVHGQDIARPLGRLRPMPGRQTAAALDHVLASPFYGARKRLRGVRLVATDLDWAAEGGRAGVGEEVRGPAADLLLLATGRPAGLTGVSGPGTDRLAAALS